MIMIDNITTDQLIIRLAKPDDAKVIYSYRSDVIENQYHGWFPQSEQEVCDYITNMPVTFDVKDICFQFAIISKAENRLIGDYTVHFDSKADRCFAVVEEFGALDKEEHTE